MERFSWASSVYVVQKSSNAILCQTNIYIIMIIKMAITFVEYKVSKLAKWNKTVVIALSAPYFHAGRISISHLGAKLSIKSVVNTRPLEQMVILA